MSSACVRTRPHQPGPLRREGQFALDRAQLARRADAQPALDAFAPALERTEPPGGVAQSVRQQRDLVLVQLHLGQRSLQLRAQLGQAFVLEDAVVLAVQRLLVLHVCLEQRVHFLHGFPVAGVEPAPVRHQLGELLLSEVELPWVPGRARALGDVVERRQRGAAALDHLADDVLTHLHPFGQAHLLFGGEQGLLADLPQIYPDRVARRLLGHQRHPVLLQQRYDRVSVGGGKPTAEKFVELLAADRLLLSDVLQQLNDRRMG